MNSNPGDMQLVGFGFKLAGQAEAAETELRAILDVGERDLSIAEVGGDARHVNGNTVVLAGRVREHRVAEATNVVEGYGGELLTEVREALTRLENEGVKLTETSDVGDRIGHTADRAGQSVGDALDTSGRHAVLRRQLVRPA